MQNNCMNRFLVAMVILLLPLQAFGTDVMRYKFSRSLYSDDKGIGLKQPEGVACSKDRLAVADTGNGRLVFYSLEQGDPRGGQELRIPEVVYPIRLALTSKGDLFVLDARQRKVARLSSEGSFKGYVDMADLPTEGMVVPAGISVDGADNLYMLDVLGGRVLIFGDNGKFQRQINLPKEYGFVSDVAADKKGKVFLADTVNALVLSNGKNPEVFEPITGNLQADMKFASNITVDDKGQIYLTDQNGGGIVIIGQDGTVRRLFSLGWKEGTLRYPAQVCVGRDAGLFVADRENSRIQEFVPLK